MKKFSALAFLFVLLIPLTLSARESGAKSKRDANNPPMSGLQIQLDLDSNEGTYMSVNVSPDGTQLGFDLLGNIYLTPIEGGEAEQIAKAC